MKAQRVLWFVVLLITMSGVAEAAKKEKKPEELAAEGVSRPAPAQASKAEGGAVAGFLGDVAISLEEVDRLAASDLREIRQREYQARRKAFEGLVDRKLAEAEAASRNVSVADLLKAEIEDKVSDPTDEEISEYYERNKARMGGRSKEELAPQIKQMLRAQKANDRRNEFYRSLRQKAQVRFVLDPPRVQIPIPPGEPARGPEGAPVTLVEFADFQCPFCRRAHSTVEQLLEDYKEKVRYVFRDFPLAMHPRAFPASEAARCAGDQGKYWQYYESLMKVPGDFSDSDLKKRAGDIGLDVAAFTACMESDRHEAAIRASFDDGSAAGVTGTPSFFINGRMLVGALPIEEFRTIIEEELARLDGSAGGGAAASSGKK